MTGISLGRARGTDSGFQPARTRTDITRMLARIEDWKEGHGKARGRAETDRVLSEARQLLTEVEHMLTNMRRTMLGRRQA